MTDAQGRPTLIQVPGIADIEKSYDARGRLSTITQGTRVTRFSYDANGYLAVDHRPVEPHRDVHERRGRPRDSAGQPRTVARCLFAYDANGNLTSLTPPGRPAHTFEYSAGNLGMVYRAPDLGDGRNVTATAYDLDRTSDLFTLPSGETIDPQYDAAGRLSSVAIGRGEYRYNYNAATGTLASTTAPDGAVLTNAYEGSLLTGQTWHGPVAGSVTRTFDSDLRIASQTVNGADTVAFTYDNDGLLTQAGAMTLTPDAQNGLLRSTSLGTVTDTLDYNTLGELAHIVQPRGHGTIQRHVSARRTRADYREDRSRAGHVNNVRLHIRRGRAARSGAARRHAGRGP